MPLKSSKIGPLNHLFFTGIAKRPSKLLEALVVLAVAVSDQSSCCFEFSCCARQVSVSDWVLESRFSILR